MSQRESIREGDFLLGSRMARSTADQWLGEPALAEGLLPSTDGSGAPKVTVGLAVEPRSFEKSNRERMPPCRVPPRIQDAKKFELHFPRRCAAGHLDDEQAPAKGGRNCVYLPKIRRRIQQIEILTKNVDQATKRFAKDVSH